MKYRIAITITKADLYGKILSRMANGTIVAHEDVSKAGDVANEFSLWANQMLKQAPGAYKSYGIIALIDDHEGTILDTWHLGG